jgi:hypothetical protein
MTTLRPRGFMNSWNPHRKSLVLLKQVEAIIAMYQMALTIRQIFYRLVARFAYDKTEHAYKNLGELLNKARRAHRIPMEAIRDDTAVSHYPFNFRDIADFMTYVRERAMGFRLDRQQGQPQELIVMCEAAGMAGQLFQITQPYGIPVLSGGGFDSTSEKHRLGELWADADPPVHVLRVGDYDASGQAMHFNLLEDIGAFAQSYGGHVTFTQIAITPQQARDRNLPSAPPKDSDHRPRYFQDTETWQAEALDPNDLAQIVRGAIESRIWRHRYRLTMAQEAIARRELIARLDGLGR